MEEVLCLPNVLLSALPAFNQVHHVPCLAGGCSMYGPGIAVAVLTCVAYIRSRSARVPTVKTLRATPSQNNYGKLEQVLYGQLARLSFRAVRV